MLTTMIRLPNQVYLFRSHRLNPDLIHIWNLFVKHSDVEETNHTKFVLFYNQKMSQANPFPTLTMFENSHLM